MVERSVAHGSFAIERTFRAPPAMVFAAWAEQAAKGRWFATAPDGWTTALYELDFRVGGREVWRGGPNDGPEHAFAGHYLDIVPNERIIYAYDMHLGTARISVALATVEFHADGSGTRMLFTEQAAFLDGLDHLAQRRAGTEELLDLLVGEVEGG